MDVFYNYSLKRISQNKIPLESEYSVKFNYIHHITYIVNGIYCIKTKILIVLNTVDVNITNKV